MENNMITALYCRTAQACDMGIEVQKNMLLQCAKEHGYCNIVVYCDNGYSGSNYDRPAFQEMMSAVEQGNVVCVIVKDISRISRNYLHFGKWLDDMHSRNIGVIAVNDSLNSESYYAQNVSLFEAIEKYYKESHSQKIKNGIAHARRQKLGCAK